MQPSRRNGKLRYFKPQGATGYDRDSSRDYVSNALGLNPDQKTVNLDTVWFYEGNKANITECETMYKNTAFSLKMTVQSKDKDLLNTVVDQKVDTWDLEAVFDNIYDVENFIRSVYQAAKRCPNLLEFIEKLGLDERSILRRPRLTFEPSCQTSLLCCKIAPYCKLPDCLGWGSYCVCCCAEMYSQGGLLFSNQIPESQRGHLAPQIYAQCCVVEAVVCECRMVRKLMCKVEQQICCIDNRCALPTDSDVPCGLAIFGCKLFGNDATKVVGTELEPLKEGEFKPHKTTLDKFREAVGGNMI